MASALGFPHDHSMALPWDFSWGNQWACSMGNSLVFTHGLSMILHWELPWGTPWDCSMGNPFLMYHWAFFGITLEFIMVNSMGLAYAHVLWLTHGHPMPLPWQFSSGIPWDCFMASA